jgi:hypothetical protein
MNATCHMWSLQEDFSLGVLGSYDHVCIEHQFGFFLFKVVNCHAPSAFICLLLETFKELTQLHTIIDMCIFMLGFMTKVSIKRNRGQNCP